MASNKKRKNQPRQNLQEKLQNTWLDKRPVVLYLTGFLALVALFYYCYSTLFFEERIINPLVNAQTRMASGLFNLFGMATTAEAGILSGLEASVNVAKGCDGMEPLALFIAGVVLTPFKWRSKLIGLGWGICILLLLNLLRIIGLYFTKLHFPSAFDFLHLHGGFALFTMITVMLWVAWARWAMTKQQPITHAA